ncbi:response regulator transcription factor [Actinomadura verrucosospora]|uniref:Phosphate regulon response regulator PhoB n=1 Tax=Actinomadura verrucosospora TaxID=46165 RepID=A0A7D4A178_ACTVE|nr:response regulator [Actinomadura verrucosospora]QKG23264.1 phosphate regulon response regulator PhoB [Actinomadura verrucosospora]
MLIVEDSRVGELLRMILERDGHEPVVAECGEDGWLELNAPDPPELLILDRMLPDMDGADLLTRLRRHDRTAHVPVLVLTAAASASGNLDDGVRTRVLGKPFELAELKRVISALTAP